MKSFSNETLNIYNKHYIYICIYIYNETLNKHYMCNIYKQTLYT